MNRGIKGELIFRDPEDKKKFLEILSKKIKIFRIRILGYCVMNNHYHLLLENHSGYMSDFLKYVNGSYGIYYRMKYGSTGYVFQNRFKSTLIQNDSYLRLAILYLLQNPVRAGLVSDFAEYQWSSAGEYLGRTKYLISDVQYVHKLWGDQKQLMKDIMGDRFKILPLKKVIMVIF